jgi:cobalamin-dependent methionine synthase I
MGQASCLTHLQFVLEGKGCVAADFRLRCHFTQAEACGYWISEVDVMFQFKRQQKVAEIVALSAMMTTTMMGMEKVVETIKSKNPNVAIMLGGAPLTKDIASLFGADGYADSAGNALQEAIKMIGQLRRLGEKKQK